MKISTNLAIDMSEEFHGQPNKRLFVADIFVLTQIPLFDKSKTLNQNSQMVSETKLI